jgi:phosphoglycerate kinase
MAFRTLDDVDLSGKRVLLRVDLNVPFDNGRIADTTRIDRVLPTIAEITAKGGKAILLAHFDRPKGRVVPKMSLAAIAPALAAGLARPVGFATDCVGPVAGAAVAAMAFGETILLENTRFHSGEEANDRDFAAALAENGDLYVNDAFSAAHRAHASTEGLAHLLPAVAGRTMQAELEALRSALDEPEHPLMAVVGGAKVSTKIELLENLVSKVDMLVIGGGMANTFLYAEGFGVGKSLCERNLTDTVRRIASRAKNTGCDILLPTDAIVARKFEAGADSECRPVDDIPDDTMILDAGPRSTRRITEALRKARTLVWNGPLGAFELPPFDRATVALANAAAELTASGSLVSIGGGGDTVAAINHAGVAGDFTYVSTAGGAFLEWLEGKTLPGVAALQA